MRTSGRKRSANLLPCWFPSVWFLRVGSRCVGSVVYPGFVQRFNLEQVVFELSKIRLSRTIKRAQKCLSVRHCKKWQPLRRFASPSLGIAAAGAWRRSTLSHFPTVWPGWDTWALLRQPTTTNVACLDPAPMEAYARASAEGGTIAPIQGILRAPVWVMAGALIFD